MTTELTIRSGEEDEITDFPLYDAANDGEDILVVEDTAGIVVAYAMHTGNLIYFLESSSPGAGSALVRFLQEEYEELDAINCIPTAQGFWAKMGFEPIARPAFSMRQVGKDMRWYKD